MLNVTFGEQTSTRIVQVIQAKVNARGGHSITEILAAARSRLAQANRQIEAPAADNVIDAELIDEAEEGKNDGRKYEGLIKAIEARNDDF